MNDRESERIEDLAQVQPSAGSGFPAGRQINAGAIGADAGDFLEPGDLWAGFQALDVKVDDLFTGCRRLNAVQQQSARKASKMD